MECCLGGSNEEILFQRANSDSGICQINLSSIYAYEMK